MNAARRLALARAGFLETPLSPRPSGTGRKVCHAWLRRLGYLQLDTINIVGARSHTLALLSRIEDLDTAIAESLLRPKAPLFEYWGHEASWLHMDLYPVLSFRRREYRRAHPWWGPLLREHRAQASAIKRRFRVEGPLRSADFEDRSPRNDWGFTLTKRLLHALWSSGDLAVRARPGFQRQYDLSERVIPEAKRRATVPRKRAIETLVLRALELHGWAETRTLAQQWRLPARDAVASLRTLAGRGSIVPCRLAAEPGAQRTGWIRPEDLAVAAALEGEAIDANRGVLLSPFDVVLWDRRRVRDLFGFDQVLEVYKPKAIRKYGYYCMPVLVGDRLVGRCDLKADREASVLRVLSCREEPGSGRRERDATRAAVARLGASLALRVARGSLPRQA